MEKQVVATAKAPGAIGPYSQGIKVGNLVFVSGCLPIDMATGQLSTGDIAEQTRHSLRNVAAILEAAGSSLEELPDHQRGICGVLREGRTRALLRAGGGATEKRRTGNRSDCALLMRAERRKTC